MSCFDASFRLGKLLMFSDRVINVMVCPLTPMLENISVREAEVRTTAQGLISISVCESPHIGTGPQASTVHLVGGSCTI